MRIKNGLARIRSSRLFGLLSCVLLLLLCGGCEAETSSGVGKILVLVIEIVGAVLLVISVPLAAKLMKKFGLENTAIAETLVRELVKTAINLADNWARTQADKPSGGKKLDKYIEIAERLVRDAGLPAMAKEKLIDLAESHLVDEEKQGQALNAPKANGEAS